MQDSKHIVCPSCQTINRVPASRLGQQPTCGKCQQAVFTAAPVSVDGAQFSRFLKKEELPLIVDFWAEWCGPCKMMAPAFTKAARELEPLARFLKVDTEQEQQLAAQYQIRSIPSLLVFQNGREVTRQAGAMDARGLIAWVKQAIRA